MHKIRPGQALTVLMATAVLCLSGCQQGDKASQKKVHAEAKVQSAAISKNGRFAVVSSFAQPAILWDLQTHKSLFNLSHHGNNSQDIVSVNITPDGHRVLTAEASNFVVWDAKTGEALGYWQIPNYITTTALSKDGRHALIATADNQVLYIDLANDNIVHSFEHDDRVNSVSLSQNGQYAITGSDDKTAKLWNLNSGKLQQNWQHDKRVTFVMIAQNNQHAITNASQSKIRLWDIITGKPHTKLETNPITVTSANFTADGKLVAVGYLPSLVTVWNTETGKALQQWVLPKQEFWKPTAVIVHAVNFTPDGKAVMTEDSNGYWHRWPLDTSR